MVGSSPGRAKFSLRLGPGPFLCISVFDNKINQLAMPGAARRACSTLRGTWLPCVTSDGSALANILVHLRAIP